MNRWLFVIAALFLGCDKKIFKDQPLGYHQTTFHDDRFNADGTVEIFPSLEKFLQNQLSTKRPEDFVSCLTTPKEFNYLRELHQNFDGQKPLHQKTKGHIVVTRDQKTSFSIFLKEDIWPHAIRNRTEFFRDSTGIHSETYGETDLPIPQSTCELSPISAVNQTLASGFFMMESGEQVRANQIIKRFEATSNCSNQTLFVVDVSIVTDKYPSAQYPCSFESTIYSHQTVSLEDGQIVRETHKEILNSH